MADESMELKLREIFPTIDTETIHAVCTHHAGDSYSAMLQLIELLGDDEEALEVTFALLQAEELDETASQMAQDEQLALALQQELAIADAPPGSSSGSGADARAKAPAVRKKPVTKSKLSEEASRLLVKFGRSRAKTGAQRLLDISAVDSAEIPDDHSVDASRAHVYASNVDDAQTPSEELLPSHGDSSVATGVRTGEGEREAQYNARLMRARAARQPSTTKRDGFHSIMTNA